jgi:hypothetical protein
MPDASLKNNLRQKRGFRNIVDTDTSYCKYNTYVPKLYACVSIIPITFDQVRLETIGTPTYVPKHVVVRRSFHCQY